MTETATTDSPTLNAYQELQYAYDFFNKRLFNNELPNLLITFQRGHSYAGYFSPDRFDGASKVSEIAMNPEVFFSVSLADTLSTLVHEMVHAWQHYAPVKKARGGYHCRIWGAKMEEVGLMPSSTGQPGGKKTGQSVSHYVIKGGPFQEAVFELIKDGFALSWYDIAGTNRRYLSVADTEVLDDWVGKAGVDDELIERLTKTMGQDHVIVGDAPDAESVMAQAEEERKRKAAQRSGTRRKYTCSGCGLNAWAKAGANLVCGDCELALDDPLAHYDQEAEVEPADTAEATEAPVDLEAQGTEDVEPVVGEQPEPGENEDAVGEPNAER